MSQPQRRYSAPKAPSAPITSASPKTPPNAKVAKPQAKGATTAKGQAADYDIVAVDGEFETVIKHDKDINGTTRNVSLRLGAIWKGRPRDNGTVGAPFVVLGADLPDAPKVSAKMFTEEEGEDGSSYTLRLTEMGGDGKKHAVNGPKGKLGTVWWPTGGLPQFTFTEEGSAVLGGQQFGLAFQRGNGRKN